MVMSASMALSRVENGLRDSLGRLSLLLMWHLSFEYQNMVLIWYRESKSQCNPTSRALGLELGITKTKMRTIKAYISIGKVKQDQKSAGNHEMFFYVSEDSQPLPEISRI